MSWKRFGAALVLATAAALLASDRPAEALDAAEPPTCAAWDVDYTLAANLDLSDTPLGEGDGTYPIGPGSVTLRFDDVGGRPGGAVTMRAYRMREHFVVRAKTLFWTTTVLTDSATGVVPGPCSAVARGALAGSTLRWATPLAGYHTDGTLTCDGSLCGKFGAPPPGQSPLHIAPHPVPFGAFTFGPDLKTFRMARTFVAKTETPKQTSHLQLAGREVRRTCVQAPTCK